MRRSGSMLGLAASAAAAILLSGHADAQDKTLIIGVQCDRTGATQIVGTVLCPAMHDYYNLVNSKGGMARPMLAPGMAATDTPTSRPCVSTTGPPLLPGLRAPSICT